MKFVVCAGGTGGHFYPGLAVARALMGDGHAVTFFVREGDYVLPFLEREGIPFRTLSAAGFRRRVSWSNLGAALKVATGIGQAVGMVAALAPDAVLVMGGYLSFAPALAARLKGIPVILHEQNAVPGLANRIVSRFASRIAVSFEGSRGAFGPKAVLTGNPVRPEFRTLPSTEGARRRWGLDASRRTVLIFGGSLGAQRLNTLAAEAFSRLGPLAASWQALHFTGPADVDRVRALYAGTDFSSHVDGYCHEMPAAYAAADLVISRAGASTISELIAVRKPAILVPYPLATAQHQTKNASILVEAGAAVIREQPDLAGGELAEVMRSLFEKPAELERMASAYSQLSGDPFAAAGKIRDMVISAAKPA